MLQKKIIFGPRVSFLNDMFEKEELHMHVEARKERMSEITP
jgi:hypothetical protein